MVTGDLRTVRRNKKFLLRKVVLPVAGGIGNRKQTGIYKGEEMRGSFSLFNILGKYSFLI